MTYLYRYLPQNTPNLQTKVSKNFDKINEKELLQYLQVLTKFRNVCAHNLYDDRIVMMFNSKEGARTITLDEIEENFRSDITASAVPKHRQLRYRLTILLVYSATSFAEFIFLLFFLAKVCR